MTVPALLLAAVPAVSSAQQTTGQSGFQLGGVDLVGLGLVGLLILLGIARGLWWQVIRLLGVVAAVIVARVYDARLAQQLTSRWPELDPRLTNGVAWLLLFLVVLLAATLLGMLGHRLLEAMQLGLVNRLAGGVLGAATGLLLHLVLVVVLVQLAPPSFVERNLVGTFSQRLYAAADGRWQMLLNPVAAAEVQRMLAGEPDAEDSGGSVR